VRRRADSTQYFDRTFAGTDVSELNLATSEFEACTFTGCDFANADVDGAVFRDCRFESCNFAMVKFAEAVVRDAIFRGCKLTGADFSGERDFTSFRFEDCLLDYCNFERLKIKNTCFIRCSLKEADFTGADLHGAQFDACVLTGAVFAQTNLEHADFRTAQGFSIDPERNRLRKAKFSLFSVVGLLDKYGIVVE
jgi:fluoroquinolone resistance protein